MEPLYIRLEDANRQKASKIQKKIVDNIDFNAVHFVILSFNYFNTILPSLRGWHDEFRIIVEKAVLDCDMQVDLERYKIINWCKTVSDLHPLNTLRDGNCLLHAISTYIWGIQDTSLTLRRLLHTTLIHDVNGIFKTRYVKYKESQIAFDLIRFTDENWDTEWKYITEYAKSKENPSFANPHSFLEPIHIFIMANILRRPIIVMADPKYHTVVDRASFQENDVGGIYLPLQVPPENCCKYPVVLGFTLSHFCPLVICKEGRINQRKAIIPLVLSDLSPLPVRFLMHHEVPEVPSLLRSYFMLQEINYTSNGNTVPISGVQIGTQCMPEELDLVSDYFKDAERKYRRFLNNENDPGGNPGFRQEATLANHPISNPLQTPGGSKPLPSANRVTCTPNLRLPPRTQPTRYYGIGEGSPSPETMHYFQNRKCITPGCKMHGSAATGNMCSACLKKYTEENSGPPAEMYTPEYPTAPPPSMPPTNIYHHPSMLPDKCIQPSCRFHASKNTHPYCHECYKKVHNADRHFSHSSSTTEEKARLSFEMETPFNFTEVPGTSRNEEELFGSGSSRQHQTSSSITNVVQLNRPTANTTKENKQTCVTQGCPEKGVQDQNGKCRRCYVGFGTVCGQKTTGSTSYVQLAEAIAMEGALMEGAGIKDISSAQTPSVKKFLCSKPGCDGLRQNNEFQLCFSCDAKQRQNALQEYGRITENKDENIIESRTPTDAIIEARQESCMDDNSTECASPLCENRVYPPNKLCQSCLDVLRRNHAGKSAGCRTINCHGSSHFNGYCPNCYQHKANKRQVSSAPIARRNVYPVEEHLVEKKNTSPILRRDQCLVQGCYNSAEPGRNGMCNNCFLLSNPSSAPIPTNLHIGHQPSVPIQEGYICLPNASPSLRYVEGINPRKGSRLCKAAGCNNYGNAQSEGFCNECYKKFKVQFKNNPRHLLERNG